MLISIALRPVDNQFWRLVDLPTVGIVSLALAAFRVRQQDGEMKNESCASPDANPNLFTILLTTTVLSKFRGNL
ncbi:MAG: hypothetical protein KDE19_06040, partial [Caldilineaceae bacterium]|nr:hypothetical protein [Caldilineaceae bacterium]